MKNWIAILGCVVVVAAIFLVHAEQPVENAFVMLEWTDGKHSYIKENSTQANGYYEMTAAEGTVNITASFSEIKGNRIIVVYNSTGNFSLAGIEWKNITLPNFPAETVLIKGHIYDNKTGLPIPNANVSIEFDNDYFYGFNLTFTGSNGYYEIMAPASNITIIATANGYYYDGKSIGIVGEGETRIVDLYVEPLVGIVKGYVNDTNGLPVQNAMLVVGGMNNSYYNENFSDSSGYYEFEVIEGNFSMQAIARDYFMVIVNEFHVGEGETKWINITMQPFPPDNAWVDGYVLDKNDNPIPNANVSVTGTITVGSLAGTFIRETQTNESGYYIVSVPSYPPMIGFSYITLVGAEKHDYFENSTSLFSLIVPGVTMHINVTLEKKPEENCMVKGYVYMEAAPPAKKIHYVGGMGAGNYTSIQDAIENASNGDIIKVYPGIYDGPVVINKEIKLIGDPAIDGHGDYGIKIEANNTLVENFTVFNCSIGILAYNSSFLLHNVTVNNCTSYNCTDGIKFYYVKESIINASYVHNCTSNGIYLENSYNNNITACIIENITGVNEYAIHLKNANDNRVEDNKIFMKDTFGGIGISNSKRNIVIGNTITGEGDNSYGIIIWEGGSRNNKILNNSIYDISYAGIALGYSSTVSYTHLTLPTKA